MQRSAAIVVAGALAALLSGCGGNGGGGGGGGNTSKLVNCQSDLQLGSLAKPAAKGLVVDDTTLQGCSDKIPQQWPHTNEPISSLRLFKAWGADWPAETREQAWDSLVAHVKSNNIQVLVGTQVSCSEEEDDADWDGVQALLKRLGANHVMGVAVGNELELCGNWANSSCCERIWFPSEKYPKGYYSELFAKRAHQLDQMEGFGKTKLTAVFGAAVLAPPGLPFLESTDCEEVPCGRVSSWVADALKTFKNRYVFAINLYGYLDSGAQLDADGKHCMAALERALCFQDKGCYMNTQVAVMRERMQQARGDDQGLLWVGETGWSSPKASTLTAPVKDCDEWSTKESFQSSYENFVSWDLSMPGVKGPDHVFYFTTRDSNNFGHLEYFGMLENCDNDMCKLQGSPSPAPSPSSTPAPHGGSCCTEGKKMDCCATDAGCCPAQPAGEPLWCCSASDSYLV